MFEKQRLHPAAIFFTLLKTFKELIFSIGVGFFAFKDAGLIYFVIGASVLILMVALFSTLSWYRYTYRLEEDELRIEHGIFIRKKRYISKNRIQSIDLTQSVVHRIFKLVRVNIETAGSGIGTEASLKAVKLSTGEALRKELKSNQTQILDDPQTSEYEKDQQIPSKKISMKRLFLAGTTSGSIGIIFVLLSFLFSEIGQFIPEDYYENTFQTLIGFGMLLIAVLVLVALLALWFLGIAGTMIKYGNFTISKNDDEIFITRGLLEKKQTTIPIKRIQAVGIDESLIRQPLGYVTIFAEVAGGSLEKGQEFSTILFPIMKRSEVDEFLRQFLPEYVSERSNLNGLPSKAKTFYLVRSTILVVAIVIAMIFLLPTFVWAPVILLLLAIYIGLLRYKDAGFRVEEEQLTMRFRVWNRKTIILFHKRIQSFEKKQHVVQRKSELATIKTSIVSKYGTGKHYKIKELSIHDVMDLVDWYSYRK